MTDLHAKLNSDTAAMIAGRVRDALEQTHLTQSQIAQALGVTQACVSNWKSGRRPISAVMVVRLAAVLGIDERELLPDLRQFGQRPAAPPDAA